MATLCLFSKVNAQFYKPSEKTIRMGESLPESFYQTVRQAFDFETGKSTKVQLKNYKDKLIILDFWATWCSPCIFSLNKIDSIQKTMKDSNFIVVPVTYQLTKEIIPNLNKLNWNLTSIVGDTSLAKMFPHSSIPHQVWIKNNKLYSIPKPLEATSENIKQVLMGKTPALRLNIQDNTIDPSKPLFVKGNGETGLFYKGKYSVIARYLPNYGVGSLKFLLQKDTSILYTYNVSITQLFYQAFEQEIFSGYSANQGLIWNVSEELKHQFITRPTLSPDSLSLSIRDQWVNKNNYGYNLRYPKPLNKADLLKMMQRDLNLFFGIYLNINASIKKGPIEKYLVLRLKGSKATSEHLLKSRIKSSVANHSGDQYRYTNMLFGQQFISKLSELKLAPRLTVGQVIDSTGIAPDFKIDFNFPKSMNGNLNLAQKELDRYGLYLTLEKKQVPVLIIEEKLGKP